MKTIRLKELQISNFKGIKSLKLNFGTDGNNTIYGANATGKTTVFDAFMWLLFNKDSQGRTDFEIKQLDTNNCIIHNQDVEVCAELLIIDELITVRKITSEKWTKKRGSETAEFTGNETTYFFNSVPVSQKEFQFKISNLIDENIFKIITNPLAFVSLKWQDQRKTLVEIASIPSDTQIALGDHDLENLLNEVGSQKTLEEFTAQTKHSIKQAKNEINTIPARIDELNKSLPIPIVEKNVIANIQSLESKINKIDDEINNKMSQFDTVIEKRNQNKAKIQELQSKINDIEFNTKEIAKQKANTKNPLEIELNSIKIEYAKNQEEINFLHSKIKTLQNEISISETNRAKLRQEWTEVNARQFKLNTNDTTCATCGQELVNSESRASELEYKFNSQKNLELKNIQSKGTNYKNEQELKEEVLKKETINLTDFETKNESLKQKIEELSTKIASSNNTVFNADTFIIETLLTNLEYNTLKKQIETLNELSFETPTQELTNDLKAQKQTIQAEIIKLNGYLQDNKRIEETNQRIEKLKQEESNQNQIIAQFERKLFLIEKFNKKKIDLLDESVNKLFKLVKFKLFDIQINGGIKETCEAMVNGIPFGNINTASKINAGIDIINTLCQYYKVNAPVFIDNKESVTNLLYTNSQRICLEVNPKDKVLRIN